MEGSVYVRAAEMGIGPSTNSEERGGEEMSTSNINADPRTFLPLYHSGRGSEFVTTTLAISGHSSICRRRVVHGQVGGGFRRKETHHRPV